MNDEQRKFLIYVLVGLGIVLLIIFACTLPLMTDRELRDTLIQGWNRPAPTPAQDIARPELPPVDDVVSFLLGNWYYLALALIVYWIYKQVVKHDMGGLVVFIVLLVLIVGGGISYYVAGDKTGDGVGDSMIVPPVQMTGTDIPRDSAYTNMNEQGSKTNITNMGAGMGYVVMLFLAVVLAVCIWIALTLFKERSGKV
jgi:hypothetical protein